MGGGSRAEASAQGSYLFSPPQSAAVLLIRLQSEAKIRLCADNGSSARQQAEHRRPSARHSHRSKTPPLPIASQAQARMRVPSIAPSCACGMLAVRSGVTRGERGLRRAVVAARSVVRAEECGVCCCCSCCLCVVLASLLEFCRCVVVVRLGVARALPSAAAGSAADSDAGDRSVVTQRICRVRQR